MIENDFYNEWARDMRQKDFDPIPLKLCTLLDEVKIWYFLDAIASLETGLLVGWLVGWLVMLFENSTKYTIIKDMIISIDQPWTNEYYTSALYKSADMKWLKWP